MAETSEGPGPGGATLMAVDAATLYFRAFHALPTSMRSPDGRPVNAVRGYLDMTATLLRRFSPAAYAACWDADWRPQFRVEALPSYKAHRVATDGAEEVPDELSPQVDVLAEGLGLLGLRVVAAPGHEADDVVATLAVQWASRNGPVVAVSGDRDLLQVVDDATGVRLAYVGRGVAKLDEVDGQRLQARTGVPTGRAYRDLAVLVGDRSDGLPGVAGIGASGAADLLARFGSLADLLAAAESKDAALGSGHRRRLLEARDYIARALTVVTAVRDAPLDADLDDLWLRPGGPDATAAVAWGERWGISGPVRRVLDALQ